MGHYSWTSAICW